MCAATLRPASSDASFRRYLRADLEGGGSVIVVDAPPPREDVQPFVHVAGLIAAAGLHAPRVLEADAANGFLLLDDLGNELYLAALTAAQARGDAKRADALMRDAIAALVTWQLKVPGASLPAYDDAMLRRELALFPDWCVTRECGALAAADAATWGRCLPRPFAVATPAEPRRRPSRLDAEEPDGRRPDPGILDFQERGPRRHHLRHRLAPARRLHLVGRRAGDRLGHPLLAEGRAPGGAAG